MRPRSLNELAAAVRGRVEGEDVRVTSTVVDSRTAEPGSLFVAIAGEHADGHDYVADAFRRGAAAGLVREGADVNGGPLVRVADTGRALLDLAADERSGERWRVVGVTGANGKTSTKDLAASLLGQRFAVHASPASFNNEIGVPLTLLGTPRTTEVVVAELGARHVGDAALLCAVARPEVVVVTNVGVAHMEIFGSWDAIVEAAAEPVDALDAHGVAVLAADDPVVRGFASRCRGSVLSFGLAPEADVRAEEIELDALGCASFVLAARGSRERVELSVPGEHMVQNALAAAAVGLSLGLSAAECAAGMKDAHISAWRMETFSTPDGILVLNDAYNANPESMAAALRAARWMARGGRLIAVLGHMAELGPIALEEHERIGDLATRLRVDRLIAVGSLARPIAMAAVREGIEPENVSHHEDPADALADVLAHARAGDVVLFKASRVAGLERLAQAMRDGASAGNRP